MSMRSLMMVAALVTLGACTTGPTLVVMQNPASGQVAQCQDDARLFGSPARVETCAQGYEKAGWVRLTR